MHQFKIGDSVILIGTDGFMPPLGSIGTILTDEDIDGDHDVLFVEYPCPTEPGDPSWFAHKSWLLKWPVECPDSEQDLARKLMELHCSD